MPNGYTAGPPNQQPSAPGFGQGLGAWRKNYLQEGGGGLIGGMIGQFFGGQSPGGAAQGYLDQIGPMLTQAYNPYIQAGQRALPTLENQYGGLVEDPAAKLEQFGAGYKASPGYQYQVDEATRAANQAASAGGMLGSPAEQAELAKTVGGIASQDYYKYLGNVMGLYGQGLAGTQGLYGTGFQATSGLSTDLAESLMSQANAAAAQAAQQQQQGAGIGGEIGDIAGSLIAFL